MGRRAAFIVTLLIAAAGSARAEDAAHPHLSGVLNDVFGKGAWRVTGGYRTPERENELRRQGAGTVPPGALSRHSMGTHAAPGAYDVVVHNMSIYEAASRLRQAGAPFRRILAEAAHGSQGAHLHLEMPGFGGSTKGSAGPPRMAWLVSDPTPAEEAFAVLYQEAQDGDAETQFMVGLALSKGVGAPKDLIGAYIWIAKAAASPDLAPERRREADAALGRVASGMNAADLGWARRFVANQSTPSPEG